MSHTTNACACQRLGSHTIEEVRRALPPPEEEADLAELFRMLSDPTRLKILAVLGASDMCVCHIAEALGMTVSAISHQLRLLKAARLVSSRRDGKSVIYSLADDHVRTMMASGREHVNE